MSNLADRIKQRRQQAGVTTPAQAQPERKASTLPAGEHVAKIKELIKRNEYDPFRLADELAILIQGHGLSQVELAKKLSVTQGWISKRLSLLKATAEEREKIKKGELKVTDFYASIADRSTKITIARSQAVEIAKLFRDIAVAYGLHIELSKKPTQKEITAALARVRDIRKSVLHS